MRTLAQFKIESYKIKSRKLVLRFGKAPGVTSHNSPDDPREVAFSMAGDLITDFAKKNASISAPHAHRWWNNVTIVMRFNSISVLSEYIVQTLPELEHYAQDHKPSYSTGEDYYIMFPGLMVGNFLKKSQEINRSGEYKIKEVAVGSEISPRLESLTLRLAEFGLYIDIPHCQSERYDVFRICGVSKNEFATFLLKYSNGGMIGFSLNRRFRSMFSKNPTNSWGYFDPRKVKRVYHRAQYLIAETKGKSIYAVGEKAAYERFKVIQQENRRYGQDDRDWISGEVIKHMSEKFPSTWNGEVMLREGSSAHHRASLALTQVHIVVDHLMAKLSGENS